MKRRTKVIHCYLDPELDELLTRLANKWSMSKSSVLRMALINLHELVKQDHAILVSDTQHRRFH